MIHPQRFKVKAHEEKVYKLIKKKKNLYGLIKQSSRQRYLKFHHAILEIGFEVSSLDHYTMFT